MCQLLVNDFVEICSMHTVSNVQSTLTFNIGITFYSVFCVADI